MWETHLPCRFDHMIRCHRLLLVHILCLHSTFLFRMHSRTSRLNMRGGIRSSPSGRRKLFGKNNWSSGHCLAVEVKSFFECNWELGVSFFLHGSKHSGYIYPHLCCCCFFFQVNFDSDCFEWWKWRSIGWNTQAIFQSNFPFASSCFRLHKHKQNHTDDNNNTLWYDF